MSKGDWKTGRHDSAEAAEASIHQAAEPAEVEYELKRQKESTHFYDTTQGGAKRPFYITQFQKTLNSQKISRGPKFHPMKMPGTTFPTRMTCEASGEDIVLTEVFLHVNFLAAQFPNFAIV